MENKAKDMKQTPIQTAIEQAEARIKYLFEQEILAINELDAIANPLLRQVHWSMIKELATRRGELEMYSLKPLQSLLPYERECFVDSYKDGYIKHVSGSRCNLTNALTDLAQDYFTSSYNNPQGGGGNEKVTTDSTRCGGVRET